MRIDTEKKTLARILIVEDDQGISDLLKDVLAEQGYDVHVFGDGLQANKEILNFLPDLVLMDLGLPGMSGYEILEEVRKKDREMGSFTPVIVLTGIYTSRSDKAKCLDTGADDFISKPFDMIELLARVRSLLRIQELYKRSQFLASHDPLTKCYNRRYLLDFLSQANERFKRYSEPFSFLLLDMDHFKEINDQAGHEVGDQVLVHVAFALQDFFRAVDCVARLGGDEFAAILPGCGPKEAEGVGERLIQFMNDKNKQQTLPENIQSKVQFSVGIACLPQHTKNKEELMRLADEAMYAAKQAGRNQFRVVK